MCVLAVICFPLLCFFVLLCSGLTSVALSLNALLSYVCFLLSVFIGSSCAALPGPCRSP